MGLKARLLLRSYKMALVSPSSCSFVKKTLNKPSLTEGTEVGGLK